MSEAGRTVTTAAQVGEATGPRMSQPTPLLLVDEVRFQRDCLAMQLGHPPGRFAPILLAGNAGEALWHFRTAPPAVALVKWDLPGGLAPDLARQLTQEVPAAKVLLIGVPWGRAVSDPRAGGLCTASVPKEASLEELIAVVEEALRGTPADSTRLPPRPTAWGTPPQPHARANGEDMLAPLTRREQQVAELIVAGLTNKEIANWLHVSLHTVKNHVHNILEKRDLTDRHALARHCGEAYLVGR
jgi:two-component system, NarL family, nitrate/nitrite response regulator NarL